jgi:hypothetical protein
MDVDPAVVALSRDLLPETDDLAREMADRIRAAVPVYRDESVIADAEHVKSCADNLRYVLGSLAGDVVPDDPPRRTGAARAAQGVPYASVLQAYRVGGRFIWELLVERSERSVHHVLLAAAADIWAVTDELSAQVTEAYRAAFADRARRDGQMRSTLVGSLLDDIVGDEQLWESATALNLPRQGELVVVAAECPSPGEEGMPDIERVLARRDVVSAWRLELDYQEGLVALRAGFGVTALVAAVSEVAVGRVGLSSVIRRIDHAPAARREARLALDAVTPASTGWASYDPASLAILLAANPDAALEYARGILGPLLDLGAEDRSALLQTARVWLEESGSTSAAAQRLFLHRNTVRYRTRRLEELTGRNVSNPVAAGELHVALECARILGLG